MMRRVRIRRARREARRLQVADDGSWVKDIVALLAVAGSSGVLLFWMQFVMDSCH